jgi:hypothetical protein
MSFSPWRLKRDKAVLTLNSLTEGSEIILFANRRVMAIARNDTYLFCAKKLLELLRQSLGDAVTEKPHYLPFIDSIGQAIKHIDEAHENLLKADEVNVTIGEPDAQA